MIWLEVYRLFLASTHTFTKSPWPNMTQSLVLHVWTTQHRVQPTHCCSLVHIHELAFLVFVVWSQVSNVCVNNWSIYGCSMKCCLGKLGLLPVILDRLIGVSLSSSLSLSLLIGWQLSFWICCKPFFSLLYNCQLLCFWWLALSTVV